MDGFKKSDQFTISSSLIAWLTHTRFLQSLPSDIFIAPDRTWDKYEKPRYSYYCQTAGEAEYKLALMRLVDIMDNGSPLTRSVPGNNMLGNLGDPYMNLSFNQPRLLRNLLAACLLGCFLSGCTVVGPAAVHSGRLAYNEAIIETDNQQMLLVVVHNRYGERSNLLAVASVTANVRIATSAGIEVGVGDKENYTRNLVPFSAGVSYEENPTISYTPVGGEQYARQLMSPLPIALLAQLIENLVDPAPIYYALVSSINGIYNPDFLSGTSTPDARFARVVTIMTKLSLAHRLYWIQQPQQENQFAIVIDHYAPDYASAVDELLTLLRMPAPENRSSRIVLPVSLMLDEQETGRIVVTTRSVFNLLGILSGAVEIPEKDRADGVAINYPPPGLVGKQLQVHYSKNEPEHASVAVRYRDGWFYIDEKDQATKQFFRILTTLLSINIADSVGNHSAPVLTVPVSR